MGSQIEARNDQSDSTAVKLLTSELSTSAVLKFDISLQPNHAGTDDDDDDDDCRQYQPGDELRADVVLMLASPLRASSVTVELRGEATVAWKADGGHRHVTGSRSSSGGGASTASSRWYEASELYVDDRHDILLGAGLDQLLPPGEHRFPVAFQLPRTLPTSFRGQYGAVSYALRASLNLVDRTSSPATLAATMRHVTSDAEPLVVRRPSARSTSSAGEVRPVTVRLSRRLFAAAPFVCASGQLRVDFTVVDGTAYRLGDDIRVTVAVTNDSPRVVVGVDVALVQLCEFRAQRARRRCAALVSRRRDVAGGRLAPVGYADTVRCATFRLDVPPDLTESRLNGCDIIDVGYELRFAVQVASERIRTSVLNYHSSHLTTLASERAGGLIECAAKRPNKIVFLM